MNLLKKALDYMERIIAIKKQLGVLFKHGKDELLTEYDIDVIDDILSVYDGQGKSFHYDKNNVLSQSVQETLFNEKRTIIENCLFGVDLNSKAVAICQLRLWIELLKNAYYKNEVMETLPNIDINIKSGNSLINKLNFAIGSKIGQGGVELEKNTQKLINQYKKLMGMKLMDCQLRWEPLSKEMKLFNWLVNYFNLMTKLKSKRLMILYIRYMELLSMRNL